MKKFTKEDLKAGMLVKYRNDGLRLVENSKNGLFFIGIGCCSCDINNYNDNLIYRSEFSDFDIVEVYGITETPNTIAGLLTTNYRELLWKRNEPKKMTMKELHETLGYEVEIVEEH